MNPKKFIGVKIMAIFLFFISVFTALVQIFLNKYFWDKVFKDENPEEIEKYLEVRIRILHYCFRN